jgi:hypothetical protein
MGVLASAIVMAAAKDYLQELVDGKSQKYADSIDVYNNLGLSSIHSFIHSFSELITL